MIIPIKSFSTQVYPLDFEKIVSNIHSAYQVKVLDTMIVYKYETNRDCNETYVSSKIVRIKYVKLSNWLSNCDIDCCEKLRLDTFTTEFIEKYPILFLDCRLNYYSIEVPWTGTELELKPGGKYNFYFSDSTEKLLYRAETPNYSHINILRLNKTFRFIEFKNLKLYLSIKTFEFDDIGGIFVLSESDSNIYYFNSTFNLCNHFEIGDIKLIKLTNRMIYDNSELLLYRNSEFLVKISMDKFKN